MPESSKATLKVRDDAIKAMSRKGRITLATSLWKGTILSETGGTGWLP